MGVSILGHSKGRVFIGNGRAGKAQEQSDAWCFVGIAFVASSLYLQSFVYTFAGKKLMARSASAVIVKEGFTPGLAETALPSITYKPS